MSKILHEFTDASNVSHTVRAIKASSLNNGQLSVCLRCCEHSATDHWHTFSVVDTDPAKIDAELTEIAKIVGAQHASMLSARKYVTENLLSEDAQGSVESMRHLD